MREFEQRLSVVGKQSLGGGKWGLWVELKTSEGRGAARIERGFFAPASLRGTDLLGGGDGSQIPGGRGDAPPADPPPATETPASGTSGAAGEFVLLRYQVLTSGGKLYEYPVGSTRHSRASGDVASFELFEYDPAIRPIHSTIGPDTLVLGRRLVPATVDQTIRHGTDRWPHPADPSREAHLVLTQRYWRNPAVPLTGYARSLFRAEIAAVADSAAAPDSLAATAPGGPTAPGVVSADSAAAARADSAATATAPTDSAAAAPPAPATPATDVLAWTELTLVDIGADARAEVNQEPELAPDIEESEHDPSGFQR
ncbi:MAG TPA: hypothetical protein VFT32_06465 [Candidatus Eisenbacteria bacterium]|nr:hypothetical protein [Candidatus Eisenbacteria bacterium]